MRNLLPVYAIEARMSMQRQAQYRGAAFISILGFLIEPVVYLIVWRTVAEASGPVGGYGVDEFTSYYIVWTLVRVFNLALAPGAWDWWVRTGRISNDLLHPVTPYHRQLAGMAGAKVVWIIVWIPVALFLVLLFRPDLSPTPLEMVTFFIAAWAGYVVRFNVLWILGLVSFWTTRAQALVEVVVAMELLLSGRLVPMAVMPQWVQTISAWLPFQWTFLFPIEILIGQRSVSEIWSGLGIQLLWIGITGTGIVLVWRAALRKFTAVGT
ncbi:MAG TPA: ABC-2 family transporter protein [Acidimicrobiia bacterium]|nr:ABC-2 family transporter protein [Acidimicrobiia bacterium]